MNDYREEGDSTRTVDVENQLPEFYRDSFEHISTLEGNNGIS